MATSIEDFDYGSIVDEIRGQTRRSKPSFLKRYGGDILTTLVGVADNYQSYKLREKMDEANFENNIELAKIRAEAAKHIKRSKETSGQYDKLLSEGFQFDDESKGSQQNLNAARKVFGDQAWATVSSQFPNLIPRHNFKNYQDYEDQRASWGMNEESHQAVENLYNSIVMDKANYVRSGQAFDFEKFNVNLKSLEDQGITIDPDNYGLLSKVGGKLARKLQYQQEQIAAFRNRYLTSEIQKGVEAMEQWTGAQTPEEYYQAVKDSDLGIWASLSAEDAGILTQLAPGLKQEATDALQKVMHRNPNMSMQEFNSFFNSIVFGDQGRTAATTKLTLFESLARKAVNADPSLTNEQKAKKREEISKDYDALKNEYASYSEEKVDRLIGARRIINSVEEQIQPLIVKQDSGTLMPDEKIRLKQLQRLRMNAQTSIDYIDSSEEFAGRIAEERASLAKVTNARGLAAAYVDDFHKDPSNNTNPLLGANSVLTEDDAKNIIRNNLEGITEPEEIAALMDRAVTPRKFNEVSQSEQMANISRLTAQVRLYAGEALGGNTELRERLFNTLDTDEVDEYLKFLGPDAVSDKTGGLLSINAVNMAQFDHFANQVFDLSKEAINKNEEGFFYGKLPTEAQKREIIMDVYIDDFTFRDEETDRILVKSSSLGEVANAVQRKLIEYENKGKEQFFNANLDNATLIDEANEARASGNIEKFDQIMAFVRSRQEGEQQKRDQERAEQDRIAEIEQRVFREKLGKGDPDFDLGKLATETYRDIFGETTRRSARKVKPQKDNRPTTISDEEMEEIDDDIEISQIANSIMNLRAFTPNEEGLQRVEDEMIEEGIDRNIIDGVLANLKSKRDK